MGTYSKVKKITPRLRRGSFNSRQIRLLISGDGDLTHATQHGSCYSEIAGDRSDDRWQGNGRSDDGCADRGQGQSDVSQLLKERGCG